MPYYIDRWDSEHVDMFLTVVRDTYRGLATDSQLAQLSALVYGIHECLCGRYAHHRCGLNSFCVTYCDGDLVFESAYSTGRVVAWLDRVPDDSLLVVVDGRFGIENLQTFNMDICFETMVDVCDTMCRYCVAFVERDTYE